ncbi:OmpA family protein [Roseisolibacter agri]|uniref:OmpA-like domain-containing protein n=1 Tax=Roseisolibacter agri TaxID=2014610 RepID=A0AA37V0N3_9BACT|nr:OmpA family protein [Roseisolibacter agri]GLC24850.1 hypothetical protein rosag_13630 [Roseisolibacter agri]
MRRHTTLVAALLVVAASAPRAAHAQLGDRLRRAAEAAKRRAGEQAEERAERPKVSKDAAAEAPAEASEAKADTAAAPTVNSGRDFTPGTRVLYATDFTRDELGDFPRAFRLRGGNTEVAEIGRARWLRATSFGEFEIPLSEKLPERFTMEFDFIGPSGWSQYLYFTPHDPNGDEPYHLHLSAEEGGVGGPNGYDVASAPPRGREGAPLRVQVMADGDYVKVYLNGVRVANAPNAALGRSRVIRVRVSASDEAPVMIANLRIAAGGKDLYAALESSGRVTADGILFDTNSDRLRAESTPVLQEIAAMLAAHPELRVAIEGHTDDAGAAAANQSLSERRAAAVRRHLVTTLGVDAARLTSAGFGATRPVAPNDSEANRQRNRRVELVKR